MNPPSPTPAASQQAVEPADVTVLLATYNRADFLPDALNSILRQTLPVRQVIVVDDGSTDDTAAVVRAFGPAVDYRHVVNGGKAKAVNTALSSVTTRYFMVFDDDDVLYPDAIARLYTLALERPDCAFVFGSHDSTWHLGHLDNLEGIEIQPGQYKAQGLSFRHQRIEFFRDCTIMLTGALVQTDRAWEVGGLDASLRRSQDYGFLLQLAVKSPFAFCGHSVYLLRQHEGVRGTQAERHAAVDRVKVWATYAEQIGQWLSAHTQLADFDPQDNAAPSASTTRRQHLQRAWALATKVAPRQTVADLLAAFDAAAEEPLDEMELRCLRECLHDDFLQFRPARPFLELVRLATLPHGRIALRLIAKGAWWMAGTARGRWNRLRWRLLCLRLAAASSGLWAGGPAPARNPTLKS